MEFGILKPKEIVAEAAKNANEKTKYNIKKTLSLSFLGGAYIAVGSTLSIMSAYGFPALAEGNPAFTKFAMGAVFPIGLIMIVIAGAELFTGNTAYFIPLVMKKDASIFDMLKNWFLVWSGNFVGALFFAYFFVYSVNLFDTSPWIEGVYKIADYKTSHTFYETFLRAIGANWLVCIAMWLGMSAKTTIGKIAGIWWPIMCFVTLGYEHSIANMFFIPLAMMEGADITIIDFLIKNLIPATLGNIVGGAFFVGSIYWYVFMRKEQK